MEPQIVLITGCSSGIGHGTALHLANDSQRRFKVYATMRDFSTERQDEIKNKAGRVLEDTLFIREIDVTKQETIDKTVKEILDKEGRIDVLVNNSGIMRPSWWQTALMDTFYDCMETNYFGCVRMTKAVVPGMKAQRSGKILQITSVVGFKAVPLSEQYIASKFALEGFSEAIAPPLRKFNVWVSVIQPGLVSTNIANGEEINHSLLVKLADSIPELESSQIVKRMVSNPDVAMGSEVQKVADIAKLIEEVILTPKPDYRYQTSKTVKEFARERFTDPTGNVVMNTWMEQ